MRAEATTCTPVLHDNRIMTKVYVKIDSDTAVRTVPSTTSTRPPTRHNTTGSTLRGLKSDSQRYHAAQSRRPGCAARHLPEHETPPADDVDTQEHHSQQVQAGRSYHAQPADAHSNSDRSTISTVVFKAQPNADITSGYPIEPLPFSPSSTPKSRTVDHMCEPKLPRYTTAMLPVCADTYVCRLVFNNSSQIPHTDCRHGNFLTTHRRTGADFTAEATILGHTTHSPSESVRPTKVKSNTANMLGYPIDPFPHPFSSTR